MTQGKNPDDLSESERKALRYKNAEFKVERGILKKLQPFVQ